MRLSVPRSFAGIKANHILAAQVLFDRRKDRRQINGTIRSQSRCRSPGYEMFPAGFLREVAKAFGCGTGNQTAVAGSEQRQLNHIERYVYPIRGGNNLLGI